MSNRPKLFDFFGDRQQAEIARERMFGVLADVVAVAVVNDE